jgi:glycosyltransferase involved in cell wall biosynthesis
VHILYSGLLRSPASWARVGRELLRALARLGVEVGALRVRGFLYSSDFPLPPGVREVAREEFPADVELTFAHPGLYRRLRAPRRVGLLVYEADRMPPSWVEPIRRELDLLLLPSEFCRQGAVRAGVPSHLIRLLPFGVDPRVFFPAEARPRGLFTFLTVGAPHHRKGLRELLKAYRIGFAAADGVRLVLKTTYDPGARPRRFRWELEDLATEVENAGLDAGDAPQTVIRTGTLSDEELAAVYREAHVYVQCSYGEGFGLAALEAAASGCAIITNGWGAAGELFGPSAATHVGYDLVSAGPYEYDRDSEGLMAKPRVLDVTRAMRALREDAALLKERRRQALRVAARHGWDEAGRRLGEYLEEVAARPPRR